MTLKAFSASEDEMSLANQILLFSNCQESGALKPDAAIDIFKRSGLSITILRDIWNMADENASGNLTIHELTAAIRLMGWVQVGESLDESLLSKCALVASVASVSSKTVHSSSYQPVLFRPLTESQMWLENVMLALQILDFHQ
jgi:epidermal growth factor receptor substrate 15